MIEAISCGGVVIFRGKILVLYKNFKNRYEGWVLPKGTVEPGEKYQQTALREVKEETGARASIVKFIGKSQYRFSVPEGEVNKQVYWYLMRVKVTIANHNGKSILWIPDSISIMKRIICCAFRMRSRFWKRPMRSIRICANVICGAATNIFKAVPQGWI